jgi:hypothetical protein
MSAEQGGKKRSCGLTGSIRLKKLAGPVGQVGVNPERWAGTSTENTVLSFQCG